jgi:PKD repeat protein
MKTKFHFQHVAFSLVFALFLFHVSFLTKASNPLITNNLINLSQGLLSAEYEDFNPEMVIEGNSVHALWTNRAGNTEGYLFYARSTDLGESWETPQQIWQYKDGGYATEVVSQKLAVSGNDVYVCFAHFDYYDRSTDGIYLVKSSNNGENFSEPVRLDNAGTGIHRISSRSFIKADGNEVAIVYRIANHENTAQAIHILYSSDGGNSFSKSAVTMENDDLSDFWYDGNQMIVVHNYAYYYYGLNNGRVYVSVSNDNGTSFTTNKVSVTYTDEYGEKERCLCTHDARYVPKLAKDGNNIHLVFTGHNQNGVWTILYARSVDNGKTFEETVDINNGKINNIQNGQETLAAKGGNVYFAWLSQSSKVYLVRSDNNGTILSEPESLLSESTHYIKTTWWPQLVVDPTDETGKTVYFGGGAMMTRKSVDGGQNFSGTYFLAPLLSSPDVRGSVLKIDGSGNVHWLGKAKWYGNYDFDIFYGKRKTQPLPGTENKAWFAETIRNEKYELAIVPSSPSIEFDSVMTGEAWIKMLPGSGLAQNIFSKINGADGAFYNCPGYHMMFDDNYGKRRFTSGIQTDKGEFINWTGTDVRDTLWHHVAFTYDAGAGLNNFKTYLDGLLVAEQTVTGTIIPGDGLLMIGSRESVRWGNSKHMTDDIRLWNRALTQEELLENQVKAFTGEEEGLKLWLNFDDTFKDMSGNGNDAIPLYLGELKESDFDPPVNDFDFYQVLNRISFSNKTKNATSCLWNFGNNNTSDKMNPVYTYPNPGEYNFLLTSKNSNSVTSKAGHITIAGLDRVEPSSAGNIGTATIGVIGGGLSQASAIYLRKDDIELTGENIHLAFAGQLNSTFNLAGQPTGKWDVVVVINQQEYVLQEAFSVREGEIPDPWVSFVGRSRFLLNRWSTFALNYGNNGNVDVYHVPVYFAISDLEGLEIEFVNFDVVINDYFEADITNALKDSVPLYYVQEGFFNGSTDVFKPAGNSGGDTGNGNARIYSFIFDKLPQNFASSLILRIKSPADFEIQVWTYKATQNEMMKSAGNQGNDPAPTFWEVLTGDCMKKAFDAAKKDMTLDIAVILSKTDIIGCIKQNIDYYWKDPERLRGALGPFGLLDKIPAPWQPGQPLPTWDMSSERKQKLSSELHEVAGLLMACAEFLPVVKTYSLYFSLLALKLKMNSHFPEFRDCWKNYENPISSLYSKLTNVMAFDPNEMIGPAGFGEKNHIALHRMIPYTILFENKSEATAPAHDVFITDTLDLSVFDISDFGFGTFGWGDTIFSPPGSKMKEFSMDIDLRPGLELITRVSGKLDTITGIVKWEFLSLNPITMDLEEDPFLGFLPPNVTSPEGEGFVSFSVGLKDELVTNDEIRNKASIVFDTNEPIVTNEYLNTLDLDIPQSQVYPLEANIDSRFPVDWTGSDKGSGIKGYTIYVMVNDTALVPWMINTPETSAIFEGEVGSTYKFYSMATDNVNLVEETPDGYDAQTTVTVNVKEFERVKTGLAVWPNPVKDNLRVTFSQAPCGMYVVELIGASGSVKHSQLYEDRQLQNGITINMSDCQPGNYVLRLVYGSKMETRKVVVQ